MPFFMPLNYQVGEFNLSNFKIPRGDIGLGKKIRLINGLIEKGKRDPRVRKTAIDILQDVPEKDWGLEVEEIFDYIWNNIRYTKDINRVETLQAAWTTIDLGAGDCDCQVILAGALLGSVGYPIKLTTVVPRGKKEWGHIYLKVGLPPQAPRQWLAFDSTVNQPLGWEPPARIISRKKDFLISKGGGMSGLVYEEGFGFADLGLTKEEAIKKALSRGRDQWSGVKRAVEKVKTEEGVFVKEQEAAVREAAKAEEELRKMIGEESALPFKALAIGLPIIFILLVGGYFMLRKKR